MSDFNVSLHSLLFLLDVLVRPAPEANRRRWHRQRGKSMLSEWSKNPTGPLTLRRRTCPASSRLPVPEEAESAAAQVALLFQHHRFSGQTLMSRKKSDQWICSTSSWGGGARSVLTEPGGVHYGAGPLIQKAPGGSAALNIEQHRKWSCFVSRLCSSRSS